MKIRSLEIAPAVCATVACVGTAAAGVLATSPCTNGGCTRCGGCIVLVPVAAAAALVVWVGGAKRS